MRDAGAIPSEMLGDVTDLDEPQDAFRYWARFRDRKGNVWEAIYDAELRLHEYAFRPAVSSFRPNVVRRRANRTVGETAESEDS